ncbi:YiiX/YebB-like N1pC/P60 family cysteine hydrolase, partial [Leptospira alexanderi]|uniref:YiiX/YebB-like N1pC/P60 family cysteine hydrolase n=1 Tax=Leptospira alexanderi TaxID=100053 RepID=UPI002014BE43
FNPFLAGNLVQYVIWRFSVQDLSLFSSLGRTHVKYKEKLRVLEAVEPVKITEIRNFISRGKNKHFVIKRLTNSETILTDEKLKLTKSIGKHYDIYFNWSDEKIYCTELAWKIFKKALNIELTEDKRFKDFDLSNSAVKYLMKKRYRENIPLDDFVVSPADMFLSKKLETIMEAN